MSALPENATLVTSIIIAGESRELANKFFFATARRKPGIPAKVPNPIRAGPTDASKDRPPAGGKSSRGRNLKDASMASLSLPGVAVTEAIRASLQYPLSGPSALVPLV